MAPLPDRKTLENMKRVDLQKLCKDYGVKANLKSEALIDLLLDTHQPATRNTLPRRSVSTRYSSRAGPSRISSVIIHDTDDEESEEEEQEEVSPLDETEAKHNVTVQAEPTPPVTRTRKAKEQTRLGVGRPVAAGGAGPRAVTKSLSVSKGKRGKVSKSMKVTEATIPEEEVETETQEPTPDSFITRVPIDTTTTNINTKVDNTKGGTPAQENLTASLNENMFPDPSLASLASIDKHVADALRPLHEQMKSLKSELELVQSLKTDSRLLKEQAEEIGSLRGKVETLTATVEDLRAQVASSAALGVEFAQLKESLESRSATPTFKRPGLKGYIRASGPRLPQSTSNSLTPPASTSDSQPDGSSAAAIHAHPGIAPTMLGKRHRDSVASDIVGGEQEDGNPRDDSDLTLAKPTRKRAKITQDDDDIASKSAPQEEEEEEEEETAEKEPALRYPSFNIFSGPDQPPEQYMDPPPPTDHLPDFFAPLSPPLGSGPSFSRVPATSTANASENQHPFTFSFLPMSSTPVNNMLMPSFPYPEPPQSPSPANPQPGFLNPHHGERSDVFQAFGFPPPGRPSRPSGSRNATSSLGVNPTALTLESSDHEEAKKSTTIFFGTKSDSIAKPPSSSSAPTTTPTAVEAPLKRTMYGTELDGDTRFGDFGVEGVGSSNAGFWAGGR